MDCHLLFPVSPCSYLGVLNTSWERGDQGHRLAAYSGQPVLLGGANSTNVVMGEGLCARAEPTYGPLPAAPELAMQPGCSSFTSLALQRCLACRRPGCCGDAGCAVRPHSCCQR